MDSEQTHCPNPKKHINIHSYHYDYVCTAEYSSLCRFFFIVTSVAKYEIKPPRIYAASVAINTPFTSSMPDRQICQRNLQHKHFNQVYTRLQTAVF